MIPQGRWPHQKVRGDFVELRLQSYADLLQQPVRVLLDPVTRRAVQCFFENGGELAYVFGVCVDGQDDLCEDDPFSGAFESLLYRLRGDEEIALLCMPALAYLPVDFSGRAPVGAADNMMHVLLRHAAEMTHRFCIFDAPRDLHGDALMAWVSQFQDRAGAVACHGALYYPWLRCGDELFPPSGSVGGLYARVEISHRPFGVGWPPANELLKGVTHPDVEIRWSETGGLAAAGVNPVVTQPARGVVVWGARTLSRDSRWIHINSRRIVSAVAEQLRRDSQWAVFEHQRPGLWSMIERLVSARLETVWEAGLLTGDRAGSDYRVQCDAELNPPEVRDAGQVHVRVVLRPISTTEHIVVEMRLGSGDVEMGGL